MKEEEAIRRGLIKKPVDKPTTLDYCKEILSDMRSIITSAMKTSDNTSVSIDNKLSSVITQIKSLVAKENAVHVTVDAPDNMDKQILQVLEKVSGKLDVLNITVRGSRTEHLTDEEYTFDIRRDNQNRMDSVLVTTKHRTRH